MKSRMKRTEWLLLIVPCFYLLGFGYFLRAKRDQKFALVTEKILLSPLIVCNLSLVVFYEGLASVKKPMPERLPGQNRPLENTMTLRLQTTNVARAAAGV